MVRSEKDFMRTSWVIGNWKMNGSLVANELLLAELNAVLIEKTCRMAVCVPYPYLAQAQALLKGGSVSLVAQDVSRFDVGAYTGEVSVAMLKEFAVDMVLVGHSERRQLFGETDEVVAAKASAVVNAGLTPIICLGETLVQRETGLAKEVVLAQFKVVANALGVEGLGRSVLAYEPVWAIGTGKVASAEQAQEVHGWLRAALSELDAGLAEKVSVVYGGSVKAGNAAQVFSGADVDGGLVGGASLVVDEFIGIYKAAL